MTPRARSVRLTTGLLGLFCVGGALLYFLQDRRPVIEDKSVVMRGPSVEPSIPGGELDPAYRRLRDQAEQRWIDEARAQGGSAVATLRQLEALERAPQADQKPIPAPPRVDTARDTPERAAAEREKQMRRRAGEKQKALGALLGSWKPDTHTQHEASIVIEKDAPVEAAQPEPAETVVIPAGELVYARLVTEANSDEAGPVLAEVVSGPYQGARVIGSLKRQGERVTLPFSQLSLNGRSAPIKAFAVDPVTARTGLATHVERRTFSRWAAILSSALLEGLQVGRLANTRVRVPNSGVVIVDNEFGAEDFAAIAIGEVGRRTAPLAEDYFRRPPTVTVASGTGIGLLFVQPAEIPAGPSGGGPEASSQSRLTE